MDTTYIVVIGEQSGEQSDASEDQVGVSSTGFYVCLAPTLEWAQTLVALYDDAYFIARRAVTR